MISLWKQRASRRVAIAWLLGGALLIVQPAPLPAACPKCESTPCRCGGGGMSSTMERGRSSSRKEHDRGSRTQRHRQGGSGSRSGGFGGGISITIPVGPKQTGKSKDPFDVPIDSKPKTTTKPAPRPVTVANATRIRLDDCGRPEGDDPRDASGDCCQFTSMEIENKWEREVEVTLRNEHGAVTGRRTLPAGSKFTFTGKLGECVRITVTSSGAGGALIEDARICCKDMGKKSLFFYGIRLLSFTKAKCDDPMAGVAVDGGTPQAPGGPPPEGPKTPDPGDNAGSSGPGLADSGTRTRPVPEGGPPASPSPGGGTGTRDPSSDDPHDLPDGTDPRDAELPVKIGILIERMRDDWLPENGNVTSVNVMIFRKAGANPWIFPGPPRVMTVNFVQRSAEKGVCLNFGSQTTPDLAFVPHMNSPWNCTAAAGGDAAFPDTAVTIGPVQQQLLNINSFDFGSFSRLRASAPGCVPLKRLPDGQIVEADAAEVDVPKDNNGNQIGDVWIEDWYSVPNTKDDDNSPRNPFPGDGLTAYEEYRGFMMKGVHRRTFGDEKDIFFSNPLNFPTRKFETVSGLRVREVGPGEWEKDTRILNFNRGHASGPEPQHLLKLTAGSAANAFPGLAGYLESHGGIRFGPPKNAIEVCIYIATHMDPVPGAPPGLGALVLNADLLADTVAHESGHALGAPHHGEGFAVISWIRPPGNADPPPDPIIPVRAFPRATIGPVNLPEILPAVDIPCTYSGCWTCVMRYRMPLTLVYQGGTYRGLFLQDDKDPMTEFDATAAGTGLNASGAAGPCRPGRGNCRDVLRVSDRYPNNPP